jgi:hypothetical protein
VRVPDRNPDVTEALTDQQLNEAVAEWLARNGRLPPALYVQTLVSTTVGVTLFRAWKAPKA